jgi:hypothetical protein
VPKFDEFAMSFMYRRKRRGPRTEPWGTPYLIDIIKTHHRWKETCYLDHDPAVTSAGCGIMFEMQVMKSSWNKIVSIF